MTPAVGLRSKLRALSRRERVLLVLCAAFVLAFATVRWGVYPAVQSYRNARAAIPQRLGTVARYRLAARGEDAVVKSLAEAAERLKTMEARILPGDDPAAAGSALQGILKPLVERPDTRLTSVRALAPVPKGAYAEVAVQMDLQTTTEGLAALLARIPGHPKILRVKRLSVRSSAYGPAAVNRRENLAVSIMVAGLSGARVEAKEEGTEP